MSKMLRWSESNHADWKAREAARSARAEPRLSPPIAGTANAQDRPESRRWVDQERERAAHQAAILAGLLAGPVRVILPWPPSGNHGTRHANGAHYLTAEHVAYRRTVAERVAGMRLPELVGRLRVHVTFAPPDRRRRDLDNAWKVVGDALQHAGLYRDDSAIDWLLLERTVPMLNGSVCVVGEVALTQVKE